MDPSGSLSFVVNTLGNFDKTCLELKSSKKWLTFSTFTITNNKFKPRQCFQICINFIRLDFNWSSYFKILFMIISLSDLNEWKILYLYFHNVSAESSPFRVCKPPWKWPISDLLSFLPLRHQLSSLGKKMNLSFFRWIISNEWRIPSRNIGTILILNSAK